MPTPSIQRTVDRKVIPVPPFPGLRPGMRQYIAARRTCKAVRLFCPNDQPKCTVARGSGDAYNSRP